MSELATNEDSSSLTEAQREMIELFVRGASLVGLPRSMGEIFGLLYVHPEPLTSEDIIRLLRISSGSVSQGLRQLQSFRAVRTSYRTGERRNYYVAETEFRKLISGFVEEEIRPHLQSARDRTLRIKNELREDSDSARRQFLEQRLQKLERLSQVAQRIIPTMLTLIKL